MRRNLLSVVGYLLIGCSVTLPGCESVEGWYATHRKQLRATAQLVAQEAAAIAEKDIFSNAQSAEDALLKQFNAQGFAEAGHTLEAQLPTLAIAQIPDFVMHLRQIWLPPQEHYTKFAVDIGKLIQKNVAAEESKLGRKLIPAEANQIIEGLIQGLSTAQPEVLKGS